MAGKEIENPDIEELRKRIKELEEKLNGRENREYMCLTEYDEAEAMEMFKEEGREEGTENATVSHINENPIPPIPFTPSRSCSCDA